MLDRFINKYLEDKRSGTTFENEVELLDFINENLRHIPPERWNSEKVKLFDHLNDIIAIFLHY